MNQDEKPTCPNATSRRFFAKVGLIAFISALWFVLRTGTKPSRFVYPCQQSALANMRMFNVATVASFLRIANLRSVSGYAKPALILTSLVIGSFFVVGDPIVQYFELLQSPTDDYTRVPINLVPHTATTSEDASDIFYVQNATGINGSLDVAINTLFEMMDSQGLHLYRNIITPDGLIGSNDVIIIKMNGQWDYRGGTNTDLIKSVITAITEHPGGFTGEVVIADNGQGLGNLDRHWANSYLRNQSAQDVADFFAPNYDVSTIRWDNLRVSTVGDYDEGNFIDGYVRCSVWNEQTQMYVSYPKFQSPITGTYISFKNGVWDNATGFDSERLKVINMPVLKSHHVYGVTASVKNYMGVPQGYIVRSIDYSIPHEHFSIALGGMGTLLTETRAPIINILDMIWINAHPIEESSRSGPRSTYSSARFTDIIGVSVDPVALDYWSAKNVLIPTAEYLNYTDYSSLDPDYEPITEDIYVRYWEMEESFHNYLERSMDVLKSAGFQTTMNQAEMNVFVTVQSDSQFDPSTITSGDTDASIQPEILLLVILPITASILLLLAVYLKKKG